MSAQPAARAGVAWLPGSDQPLVHAYDVALLDLDGVVYRGGQPVEHAPEALAAARAQGMRLAFVTNNASRTPAMVAELLGRLGVPAAPADVVTSAQAAARLLAERYPPGSPILIVGGRGLEEALRERRLEPVRSAEEHPCAVVQGFAPDVDWRMLAEAAIAVGRGVPWLATNADLTVPTPRGTAPGNGAFVQAITTATGVVPEVAGKPRPPLHRETVERTAAAHPLVVGDRLDTDIEGAANAGCDSLLVLTGVTGPALLLSATSVHRPTYVATDLRGLLDAPESLEPVAGGFRCGRWTVLEREGGADIIATAAEQGQHSPAGPAQVEADEGMEALRALCALSWARMDRGEQPLPTSVLESLGRLGRW